MSCGRATRLPGFEDFAHADMLTSSDCLDPKADDEDNGCFNTLIDRNVGIFYLRGGSPQALALMRAWHAHASWRWPRRRTVPLRMSRRSLTTCGEAAAPGTGTT